MPFIQNAPYKQAIYQKATSKRLFSIYLKRPLPKRPFTWKAIYLKYFFAGNLKCPDGLWRVWSPKNNRRLQKGPGLFGRFRSHRDFGGSCSICQGHVAMFNQGTYVYILKALRARRRRYGATHCGQPPRPHGPMKVWKYGGGGVVMWLV